MAETERLFFALCPQAPLQQALQQQLNHALPDGLGRILPAANIHLTLVFLGDVLLEDRLCLEQAVSELSLTDNLRGFELRLDNLVYRHRQQMLWFESEDLPAELLQLVTTLRKAASNCGLQLESRPFKAHVTLVRKLKKRLHPDDISAWGIKPLQWSVHEFVLMASRTLSTGAEYNVLKRWSLG